MQLSVIKFNFIFNNIRNLVFYSEDYNQMYLFFGLWFMYHKVYDNCKHEVEVIYNINILVYICKYYRVEIET